MAAHHLPFQQTPFLGRAAELNQICDLLVNPECQLLTLAVEAVRHCATHFADGSYFVSLAPITSLNSLIVALYSTLQLQKSTRRVDAYPPELS